MEYLCASLNSDGTVGSIIVVDQNYTPGPSQLRVEGLTPIPGVGWAYVDGAFIAPVVADDSGNAK